MVEVTLWIDEEYYDEASEELEEIILYWGMDSRVTSRPGSDGTSGTIGRGPGRLYQVPAMMSDKQAEKIINDAFESLREICVKRPRGDKATRLISNARVMLMEALESLPEVADEKGVQSS